MTAPHNLDYEPVEPKPSRMIRTIAIVKAFVVFLAISYIPGFFVNRMLDGSDSAQFYGGIAIEIIAVALAIASYSATIRRARRITASRDSGRP